MSLRILRVSDMHTVERVDPVFGVVYRVVKGKRK